MPNYNTCLFVGHLTRDVQLKFLPSQTAVADFGIAVNHKYKVQDEKREDVMFLDCSVFGKKAETISQYFQKGKAILVRGRLAYETWEDKQGGGKRSKHKLYVEDFTFVGDGAKQAEGGDDIPF